MIKNILLGSIAILLFVIMIPICVIANNTKPTEVIVTEKHTYLWHANNAEWDVAELEFDSKVESGKLMSFENWKDMYGNWDSTYEDFLNAGYSDLNGNYIYNNIFYWWKID